MRMRIRTNILGSILSTNPINYVIKNHLIAWNKETSMTFDPGPGCTQVSWIRTSTLWSILYTNLANRIGVENNL